MEERPSQSKLGKGWKHKVQRTAESVKLSMQIYRGFHTERFSGDGDIVFDSVNMTFRDEDNILEEIYENQKSFL